MVYIDFKQIKNNAYYDVYYYKPHHGCTLFMGEFKGSQLKDAIVHKEIIPTRGVTEKSYKGEILGD